MLRTASSLPFAGLLTLGPARFPAGPPACYRASWQLPGPDFHRQATTSLRTRRNTMHYVTVSPPALLGAHNGRLSGTSAGVRPSAHAGSSPPDARLGHVIRSIYERGAMAAKITPLCERDASTIRS